MSEKIKQIPLGLTYNDVLLVPKRSSLTSRSQANLSSKFTKNIALNVPVASANMVSVTEHKMAITIAREGGIGILHQFCNIEDQVREVKKVKKSTTYVIENPRSIAPDTTIGEAKQIMDDEDITSLLVTKNNTLLGMFTRRDYLFEKDKSKLVSEVMSTDIITGEKGISLEEAKEILHKNRIEKLPLVNNGEIVGLITTQDIIKLEKLPLANRDKKGQLVVAAAVGVKDTLERSKALVNAGVDCIVLDVAHAHADHVIDRLKELKQNVDIDVMVGNIATKEGAEDLIAAGADGLKVGIGPSPVCTTRIISGAGYPQLSAVMNVCEVANKHGVPVCADGGIKFPGDAAKALAAGASSIISGSLLAGTDESPGIIISKNGRRYKRYMGSASYESNHERKEYDQKKRIKNKIDVFVEGVASLVDYKGSAKEVMAGLAKGIRSGISYCGGKNIQEMQKNAEFVQMTASGWNESVSRGEKLSE